MMESHLAQKESWRKLKGPRVEPDRRDEVVEHVRYWSDRSPYQPLVCWGISVTAEASFSSGGIDTMWSTSTTPGFSSRPLAGKLGAGVDRRLFQGGEE